VQPTRPQGKRAAAALLFFCQHTLTVANIIDRFANKYFNNLKL